MSMVGQAPGRSTPAPSTLLPNLVIAGVTKCGTTSMFRYLAQHPDVLPADRKELRYFSPLRYAQEPRPLADYARHFSHRTSGRYAMEATPGYYYGGRRLAERMRAVLPDPRVVLLFRDPVRRCWSWYSFMRSRTCIDKDMPFSDYLDRCEQLHRRGVDGDREHNYWWGLGGGCYDRWIHDWTSTFSPDRLRIEMFEDLAADPATVVRRISEWLQIDSAVTAQFSYTVENRTEQYRNRRLQQTALSINRSAGAFFGRHVTLKRRLRGTYYMFNRQPSDLRLEVADRERLEVFYAPHNARLADALTALGCAELPSWLATQASPGAVETA